MIIKRNFNPLKVWQYIRRPMLLAVFWTSMVWVVDGLDQTPSLSINFTPIGILGSALAIFIAFRNSSSYARWWEARQVWGGIVNSSRVIGRLIITFTDSHQHHDNYDQSRSEAFKKVMINKCVAWVHSLRLQLRGQDDWTQLDHLLSEEEISVLKQKNNKPNLIQLMIGQEIYRAMGNGTLGGFDSFQLEGQLLALANYQGSAERIKNTPLPRQYDFFTRMFVALFSILLPFGLLTFFDSSISWVVIPASVIISGVFIIMERTGAANEDPFENKITDVPLSALCNIIERDLFEMLGTTDLPEELKPVNGYLY